MGEKLPQEKRKLSEENTYPYSNDKAERHDQPKSAFHLGTWSLGPRL